MSIINEILGVLINDLTLGLLIVAFVVFGILAIKSHSIRSFQFQISIFILIWIVGEVLHVFDYSGLLPYPDLAILAPMIHTISMILISLIFLIRYIYFRLDEKRFIDNIENSD